MINIGLLYKDLKNSLPIGEVADIKCLSIYPLPYKGYYEIWVELEGSKRYRALATLDEVKSDFTPFDLQKLPKVEK